jgi:hypothetical protein
LLIISPGVSRALEAPVTPKRAPQIPAVSMLPDGSKLKGVILPRYDENQRLTGVLKSEAVSLVSADQMAGEIVSVELFNPDQTPKARIDLVSATFYQEKGLIRANEPVEMKSDQLTASGSGLYYSFTSGKGFLLGPVTTILKPQKKIP